MPLLYTYNDEYLAPFCTEDREGRAVEEIELLAGERTFDADWTEKLTVIQTYIIACVESMANKDDLFDVKLKIYRDELAVQLPRAQAAADETADAIGTVYTIPVARA